MKKSLLALAVAAFAASSASAAVVYDQDGTSLAVGGRIQAVAYSQDANQGGQPASGDASLVGSARVNLAMRTQLTDGIAGFAFVEWDVADSDKKQTFDARDLYVGADFGVFGQLQAGRFRDAVYQGVTSTTDVFDDWGCDGQLGNDDRREGMIMYSWSGYGVDFKASYETAKDNVKVDGAWFEGEEADIKGGFSASLDYTSPDILFGPIAVKAGYGYYRFQDDRASAEATFDESKTFDGFANRTYDNYKQWAAALSWGTKAAGPLVAVTYQARDFSVNDTYTAQGYTDGGYNDYTVSGVEAVIGYGFDNGVAIRAGWEWMNIDFDGSVDGESIDVDAYTIPAYVNYQITPNFNVWAEARFDAGTDDGKGYKSFDNVTAAMAGKKMTNFEENVYSVGARYTF